MGIVMTVPCRSYSAQAFDGCPACLDAALDAVTQAGMYILGQAAPSLASQADVSGPLEMAYRLKVRLFDDADREIAEDEIDTEQTISTVAADDEWDEEAVDLEVGDAAQGKAGDERAGGSMRLDDFQTLLDLVELTPIGSNGATGAIHGRLFGYERPVCRFEIEVCRDR